MANNTLSENWLLKELGDMHWQMISEGIEKESSGFQEDLGNRLYAAFVRIAYSIHSLHEFKENETFTFNSNIERFGANAYISNIKGFCNNKNMEASLMSNFSFRTLNDNSKITKSKPEEIINHIKHHETIPDFLIQYRCIKKGLINELNSESFSFKITNEELTALHYHINPYYDINGVGLLYFASYPIISDKCLSDYFKETVGIKDWHSTYHTIYRDIHYFSNCNNDDVIIFKLNSLEVINAGQMKIVTSLYRKSDGITMAKIFTVKQSIKL